MSKRLFLAAFIVLAFIPFAAAADDSSLPQQPDPSAASALGPAATGQAGGSTADSGTLQPAGTSPLQATPNDSNGLTAPANALQAPATSDENLRVIMGEADGNAHSLSDSGSGGWAWLAWTVFIAGVVVVGTMLLRRYGSLRIPLPHLPLLRFPGRRPH